MNPPRSNAPLGRTDGEEGNGVGGTDRVALGQYRHRLRELIQQHPTSALLVALVAGYLVGRLIRA